MKQKECINFVVNVYEYLKKYLQCYNLDLCIIDDETKPYQLYCLTVEYKTINGSINNISIDFKKENIKHLYFYGCTIYVSETQEIIQIDNSNELLTSSCILSPYIKRAIFYALDKESEKNE